MPERFEKHGAGMLTTRKETYGHQETRNPVRPQFPGTRSVRLIGQLLLIGILVVTGVFAGVIASQPAEAAGRVLHLGGEGRVANLQVTKGKSQTVKTDVGFIDLVIGDPDIADVMPLTDRSLYVLGKRVGTTSVSVYDESRRLVGVVEVEVGYDASKLARALRKQIPTGRIKVASVNGQIMLTGTVDDATQVDRAMKIAQQFAPEAINSLRVRQSQQVLLEVRFVEASRSAGRALGVRWGATADNLRLNTGSGLPNNAVPFGALLGSILSKGVNADVLIEALEERGLARRLAEPNLVALSGETADFLAGGEFPFPVQADEDTITLEFKKFGVGLEFTPTVLEDRLINLKIEPEVSQIDETTVVRTAGVTVPSLISRKLSTTVELRDGQSFAVAGLLQSINSSTKEQLPWIGQIPVLGTLFSSSAFERKETDLVVIVTPRLVRPAAPGQHLATPLDDKVPPTDAEFFLGRQDEVKKVKLRRNGKRLGGHILTMKWKGK